MVPRSRAFSGWINFLLFVLLEGLSLYLIVAFNDSQHRIYRHSVGFFSEMVNSRIETFKGYFALEEENAALMEENARLRTALIQLGAMKENDASGPVLSSRSGGRLKLVGARIINQTISRRNNFLTLDKGRQTGIRENQGVIGDRGIVGITRSVGPDFTVVMSIFHSQTKISARIRDKGYFGSLRWNQSGDVRYMTLEDIPRHVPIRVGDWVESSGYSTLFPGGMSLGRVAEVRLPPGSGTYELKVKLFQDMTKIGHAWVVTTFKRPGTDSLTMQRDSL